jgi:hypothetical protein
MAGELMRDVGTLSFGGWNALVGSLDGSMGCGGWNCGRLRGEDDWDAGGRGRGVEEVLHGSVARVIRIAVLWKMILKSLPHY